jgi:hypothetical protein
MEELNLFEIGEIAEIIGNCNAHLFYIGQPVIIIEKEYNWNTYCCEQIESEFTISKRWHVKECDLKKIEWE